MTRTTRQRRADVLSAFARRAIYGLRAQKTRLEADASPGATHDLDFYAYSAWQLREVGRQTRDRLGIEEARPLLEALDNAIPRLREYRDVMTHALDDRLDNTAWFGAFAGELRADGSVDYILDARYGHHEALETFFAGLIELLEPLCSPGTKENWNDYARRRPEPS